MKHTYITRGLKIKEIKKIWGPGVFFPPSPYVDRCVRFFLFFVFYMKTPPHKKNISQFNENFEFISTPLPFSLPHKAKKKKEKTS